MSLRETLKQLEADLATQRPVAYCRLVETRGSTPQKAGALMLVYDDGSQAGTLGGGCVEAEVKRRAIQAIGEQSPRVERFDLDRDYGWDDGLICGGRMHILIESLSQRSDLDYFHRLIELVDSGSGCTEAVVFNNDQSSLPSASSFLFDKQDNPVVARNSSFENDLAITSVIEPLRALSSRPRPYAHSGVGYLPILPRCRLIIVGGGHVGKAVADLAADLDFDVWVVDDRESIVSTDRFPRAERRIHGPMDDVLSEVEVTPDTYCLIVTRGHNHDEKALYYLVQRDSRYVGLIGSRRKIKMIFEDLLDQGISTEALQRVHAPVGLNIGSQSVSEIAVSIAAELVAHRNCNGQVPGRPHPVAIET